MKVDDYKKHKNLSVQHNLRDHMGDIEHIYNACWGYYNQTFCDRNSEGLINCILMLKKEEIADKHARNKVVLVKIQTKITLNIKGKRN